MKKHLYFLIITVMMIVSVFSIYFAHHTTPKFSVVSTHELPGFDKANLDKSFHAFLVSCDIFLKMTPENKVGSHFLHMRAKDWQPACKIAKSMHNPNNQQIHQFFDNEFKIINFNAEGIFTGYYLPTFKASLKKNTDYSIPIYGLPDDLISVDLSKFKNELHQKVFGKIRGHELIPYFSRKEIHKGVLNNKAKIIAYVHNTVDRLFIEIQGSGMLKLDNGNEVFITYAAENGLPYTAIGKVLVKKGLMTPQTASMQSIREYLESHPDEADEIINQNQSFVFFRQLPIKAFVGAQGAELSPGYSLAVDRKYIPLGAPIWLDTTYPTPNETKRLQRLMVAQDTGGAIKGMVRGDVFWGEGENATYTAGHMNQKGQYWLFLPKAKSLNFVLD